MLTFKKFIMQQFYIILFILTSCIGIYVLSKDFNETRGEFIFKMLINICSFFFYGNFFLLFYLICKISDSKFMKKKL